MYVITEYQYQLLKNYYPNCSVVVEIGRQPLTEESQTTYTQQIMAEICAQMRDAVDNMQDGIADGLRSMVAEWERKINTMEELFTSYNSGKPK